MGISFGVFEHTAQAEGKKTNKVMNGHLALNVFIALTKISSELHVEIIKRKQDHKTCAVVGNVRHRSTRKDIKFPEDDSRHFPFENFQANRSDKPSNSINQSRKRNVRIKCGAFEN